ncbi:MAG: tail fiber domain-containing protein [Flavobacteriales bacterium]|nr:tail fiber domain-containing protein [Flavobacteriales bacterium]
MKTKSWILIAILSFSSNLSWSQLRIDQGGRVGLGWNWPNPDYKLHVKGDVLLTTYPEIPHYPGGTFVELKMKVGNGVPGAEIGSNVDKIAFWSTETGWNKIYVQEVYEMSDSTNKANIRTIENAKDKLAQLHGYTYEIEELKTDGMPTRFGLLAQEVRRVLPEATDSAKGILMVNYNQFIPLLIEAFKSEAAELDSLRDEMQVLKDEMNVLLDEIFKLRNDMQKCCSTSGLNVARDSELGADTKNARLFQNRPNPFRHETVIEYELPNSESLQSSIMVFNMNGQLKATFPVKGVGRGSIILNGNLLVPGLYLYSLVIEGVEIDTKRMILTD